MATRSRTLLFLSYRDSQDQDSEQAGLLNNASDSAGPSHVAIDMSVLPPKWVDTSEQVEEILRETQTKISTLDKLHAKHVLPGFTDRSEEEREIEALSNDITEDFRRTQSLIQQIAPQHKFPPKKSNDPTDRAAKNVQRALAAKVQDLSAKFRKKQRVYMEKLQGHAIKNQDLLIASGAVTLTGSAGMNDVDDDVQALQGGSQQQSLMSPSFDQTNIRSRTHELDEIGKSIASLAELFKDLQGLVIDQGTLLDSVEWNLENANTHMEESVKELKIATRYQKNTGRRKCIFLLLLIIFGLIVVLIFKPRRHSSDPPTTPQPSQTEAVRRVLRWDRDSIELSSRT
ncbi:t-SNARE [Flagelloscypha sp. PMI_526]|nr:t-SNARE [Flagelloscypha sp. PMI_526]